jgi:taurine dioxygenase
MQLPTDELEIVPTGDALGAEIRGVDLAQPLSPDMITRLRQAVCRHVVVIFPDQSLSESEQVRFSGYFGKPAQHVRKQGHAIKELFIISNVQVNGQSVGELGNYELVYHSDCSYLHLPCIFGTLYAVEATQTGGETVFCNCYAAYETLDPALKARLKGLYAVHRHPKDHHNPPEPATHPMVCTHPETGRKCLYVSPAYTKYVVGLPEGESRELLDTLFAHMLQPRFLWMHKWRDRDLLLWDNLPSMHHREPFPNTQRRILRRTQIYSERPFTE